MSDPQENGPKPVTGIKLTQGESPVLRQEIRDFRKNEDLWNLYLVGLSEFQRRSKDNTLSYFQIGGIHGIPYKIWPDKGWNQKLKDLLAPRTAEDGPAGFCTHSSILFLPWHRPYLALFESTLYGIITDIAQQFTPAEGKDRYTAAAKLFRIPYWDWARPDLTIFPNEAAQSGQVSVTMPATLAKARGLTTKGSVVNIDNPLYSYRFPNGTTSEYKVNNKPTTQRYDVPPPGTITPQERNEELTEALELFSGLNSRVPVEQNLTERVLYILQSYDSFKAMSDNHWDPNRRLSSFGSVEDIHNSIHNFTGGSGSYDGHMTDPAKSSFDPIFWLHHCNIDRLFAIWQGIHDVPGASDPYVSKLATLREGTLITLPGGIEDAQTPLAPFYKDTSNFWDSNGVKTTKTFGYAYPETQDWLYSTSAAYRASIVEKIKSIYPDGSLAELVRAENAGSPEPSRLLRARAETLSQVAQADAPSNTATLLQVVDQKTPPSQDVPPITELVPSAPVKVPDVKLPEDRDLKKLVPSNKYLEWLVNLKAQKHVLGGNFTVHIFLGPVEEDNHLLYPVSPNHVGMFSTFGQKEYTKCAKCRDDRAVNLQVTGQIPLTIALAERYFAGLIDSLEPADVTAYLKTELHWEVILGDGTRLEKRRNEVDDLLVIIVSNEVQISDDPSALPIYAPELVPYPEVTTKADGSSGRGEGTGFTDGTQL